MNSAPTPPPQPVAVEPPPVPRVARVLFPRLGAALSLLVLLGLLAVFLLHRAQFWPAAVTVGALYTAGKEGGIPLGIAAGGHPALVGALIFGTDLAMSFLFYPLVHALFNGVQRRQGFLGGMLQTAQRHANHRRKWVDRYGALGIYGFMLIPFAFNSPLVGIALGRIAALPPVRIMLAVGGAIATTTVMWTFGVAYGLQEALHVSPWIPVGISLSVTAFVFSWGFVQSRREKRLRQTQGHPAGPASATATPARGGPAEPQAHPPSGHPPR